MRQTNTIHAIIHPVQNRYPFVPDQRRPKTTKVRKKKKNAENRTEKDVHWNCVFPLTQASRNYCHYSISMPPATCRTHGDWRCLCFEWFRTSVDQSDEDGKTNSTEKFLPFSAGNRAPQHRSSQGGTNLTKAKRRPISLWQHNFLRKINGTSKLDQIKRAPRLLSLFFVPFAPPDPEQLKKDGRRDTLEDVLTKRCNNRDKSTKKGPAAGPRLCAHAAKDGAVAKTNLWSSGCIGCLRPFWKARRSTFLCARANKEEKTNELKPQTRWNTKNHDTARSLYSLSTLFCCFFAQSLRFKLEAQTNVT